MELLIVLLFLESKLIMCIGQFVKCASWNYLLQLAKTHLLSMGFFESFPISTF